MHRSDSRGTHGQGEAVRRSGRDVEALADDANDVADAYVTLCVHAGIAAADVICCTRFGEAFPW